MPVYDEHINVWTVLYVGYTCDGTQLVVAGGGNLFGAVSTVPGPNGIEGPYQPIVLPGHASTDAVGASAGVGASATVLLGPNATDPRRRWGDFGRTSRYIDQISPYKLPNGTWAALIGSVSTWFALSESARGPWTVVRLLPTEWFNTSPGSGYNENPVVSMLDGKYVAIMDSVFNEHAGFALSVSVDGLEWTPAVAVNVSGGCRTPLGLIDHRTAFNRNISMDASRSSSDWHRARGNVDVNSTVVTGSDQPSEVELLFTRRYSALG
jgi:hypothetical protein